MASEITGHFFKTDKIRAVSFTIGLRVKIKLLDICGLAGGIRKVAGLLKNLNIDSEEKAKIRTNCSPIYLCISWFAKF